MRDRTEERRLYREKNRELLRAKYKEYYQKNKEKVLKATKEYKKSNIEKVKASAKKYRIKTVSKIQEYRNNNREYLRNICKEYRLKNPSLFTAKNAKRRAKKLNASPPWITDFDLQYIKSIYAQARWLTKNTETEYHVDHIYPLQGKEVSGLHVPTNLQILPAEDNLAKSNKIT